MNVAKKNNVKLIGNLDGPTIIFAHGFGTDQSAWSKVSEAFIQKYRIILFDNVGGGNSDPEAFSPNKYDSLYAYVGDLIDICEEYKVKAAIMVGHSVSGMISLLTAIKRPEFFSKLVLVGASPRYLNDVDYVGGFEQQDLDSLYDTMANNYFAWVSGFSAAAMANPDRPQLSENFANTLNAIRPDIAQSVARVIFQSDYRVELLKLDKETLLVQAKEDIAVPQDVAEYLNKHIAHSKLLVVEAYGHFPHMSAPNEIINAIEQFI
jgi:sigma-B regulation protein RsbQ